MEIKNVQANNLTTDYLNFCLSRKNLDQKTIKSYTIDLRQYFEFTMESAIEWTNKKSIEQYINLLHCKYKPKSVKRKIASLKAFFHYLEIERAWSLKVGEPKGSFPIMTARRTNGCCKSVRVELRRKLRAFISQPTCDLISSNSFSLG